ncbi:MAG: M4 family metallopeptidase [Anaerolineae bacterium]|nr:M4 family metallopeptidase [Anaerolineae bacterium]
MSRNRSGWIFVAIFAVMLAGLAAMLVSSVVAYPAEPGPRAAWLYLNARAFGKLTAAWDEHGGVPNFISSNDAHARIPYTVKPNERGKPELIARGFLNENAALFKLGSGDSFTLRRIEPDKQLNYAHVRLDQTYHNIPVHNKQLIVHIDPQENIVAVNGHFVPDLNVMTVPLVSSADAEQVALDNLLYAQLTSAERARVNPKILSEKTKLVIYIDESSENHATLTWYITVMTDSPLGQWRYFVNARRPAVTLAYDELGNAKERQTFTADNDTDIPGRLLISEGERSRDDIAQAAHDGAGKVYDYYFNKFQRDGVDGQGSPLVSTVHFGSDASDAENAAWIGEYQQMIYGDGGRIFKPLSYGLDVVGHEFTHGVIGSTADLEYKSQSGALNESYADVFGVLIDRGNWYIGEAVIKSPPFPRPYLRSLEDPNMRGAFDARDPLNGVGQPKHVNEYARLPVSRKGDNGGVHINSGIPNHAAYLIGQRIGPDKLEQIYYRALTQYLGPDSQFIDAARATLRAAQDLYANVPSDAQSVRDGFAGVGLNVGGSDNVPAPPPPTTPATTGAPPPPSNTTPQGCVNLVVNGAFETDEAWNDISGERSVLIDTELPRTGKRSAWLGGQDKEPVQTIYQDVSIPANATRVQLEYYRYLHQETSGFSGLFASDARFGAVIANTDGEIIGAVEKLVSSQADDRWVGKQFDLSQLAGKTIRLAFTSENPVGNVSSMFVDDVALIVCTTGQAPSAPQAAANSVYLTGQIVDADTRRGVSGAQVFVMKPGLSATQAAADDQVTRSEIIASAVSDDSGIYQTDVALPVGQTYSVIIIARNYRPIVADNGIEVPQNAQNPFTVDATVRRSR